jgi:hypothetical protein
LELKKENNENAIKQTFYPNRGITLKEGLITKVSGN